MRDRKFFNKKDVLLIIFALAAAAVLWFVFLAPSDDGGGAEERVVHAEIHYGGIIINRVPLNENQIFSTPVRPAVYFEVRDGTIGFVKSDCRDQICVNTGFINETWRFAACLPNSLVLFIPFDAVDEE